MRSMIKSANFDYCCSKASVLCPMSKEELKMIVQFLYGGTLFCKNQKEASQMSENLKRFFGFPQIHLNQDLKPEIENNSNLMSENYDDLDLKVLPNDKKKIRKQSFNSGFIRHELIEDVNIKTEAKDVETDFPGHYLSGYNDENITEDQLDSKIKVESANKNDSIDIPKSDIICTICNKKLISKHQLRKHMRSKHNLGYECSICKKKLPSKLTLKQHKTNEHKTVHGKSDLCPLCGKAFKDPNYFHA